MIRLLLIASGLLVLASQPANALVELKGGYSIHTTSPSGLNDQFAAFPAIKEMQSLSVDIMANVPLMPVGLGLRHEIMKRSDTAGTLGSEINWTRSSIIVNKRFIDTLMYLGPIATIGIANDFKYRSTTAGTSTEYKTDTKINGTIGIEIGAKLLLLRVGAEAGYLYAPMGELKTSTGSVVTDANGNQVTFDMSGTYVRALIGFGF